MTSPSRQRERSGSGGCVLATGGGAVLRPENVLRLKQNGHVIDAVVYDKCADSDCNGCCTQNANQHGYGFLIDIESYSCERFTGRAGDCDGAVQWTCLDCE